MIDVEVERIVAEAEARAEHTLRVNWDSVRETAQALLEHETLSGVALDAVLSTVRPVDLASIVLPDRDPDVGRRDL